MVQTSEPQDAQTFPASKVLEANGDAVGRITGLNHMIVFVKDMSETIAFYRDILGFKVVKTMPPFDLGDEEPVGRNYFFEMADGSLIGMMEYSGAEEPSRPVFNESPLDSSIRMWPGEFKPLRNPQKVDHIAFNVNTLDDLLWFKSRLDEHGILVSDVIDFVDKWGGRFVKSIYFYDPSGNPLEISTWGVEGAYAEDLHRELWYMDQDPPANLLR